MAKDEFDFEDIEDFDDNIDTFDESGFGGNIPGGNSKTPIKRLSMNFAASAAKSFATENALKKFASNAMPKGYAASLDTALEARDTGMGVYDEAKVELKRALPMMRKAAGFVSVTTNKFLPKDVAEKLKAFAEGRDDDYREKTQSEYDDETISASLGDIFSTQMEEEARQREEDQVREDLTAKVADKRAVTAIGIQRQILSKLDQQTSFQDMVFSKTLQKGLEIQYRQMFYQRDILALIGAGEKRQDRQLQAIMHNTSLPDSRKRDLVGMIKGNFKDNLINRLQISAVERATNFIGKLGTRLKDTVGNTLSSALMHADGLIDQNDMLNGVAEMGMNKSDVVAQLAGGEVGAFALNRASKLLGKVLGKNEGLNKFGSKLQYYLGDPASAAAAFKKKDITDIGFKGILGKMFQDFLPDVENDYSVGKNSLETAMDATGFDMQSRKSLVEIIPGFLSRIHQEIVMIRTKSDKAERLVFNYDKDRFTGFKEADNDIRSRVLDTYLLKEGHDAAIKFAEALDKDNELDWKVKTELKRKILLNSIQGLPFDPKDYEDIIDVSRFYTDEDKTKLDYTQVADLNEEFKSIKEKIDNPTAQLNALMQAGLQEHVDSLSFVKKDGKKRTVSPEAWVEEILKTTALDEEGLRSKEEAEAKLASAENKLNIISQDDLNRIRGQAGQSWNKTKDKAKEFTQTVWEKTKEGYDGATKLRTGEYYNRLDQDTKLVSDKIRVTANKIKSTAIKAKDRVKSEIDELTAIHKADGTDLLFERAKVLSGEYRDQLTGKVIESVKDIKGTVIDSSGNIIARASDIGRQWLSNHPSVQSRLEKIPQSEGLQKVKSAAAKGFSKTKVSLLAARDKVKEGLAEAAENIQEAYPKSKEQLMGTKGILIDSAGRLLDQAKNALSTIKLTKPSFLETTQRAMGRWVNKGHRPEDHGYTPTVSERYLDPSQRSEEWKGLHTATQPTVIPESDIVKINKELNKNKNPLDIECDICSVLHEIRDHTVEHTDQLNRLIELFEKGLIVNGEATGINGNKPGFLGRTFGSFGTAVGRSARTISTGIGSAARAYGRFSLGIMKAPFQLVGTVARGIGKLVGIGKDYLGDICNSKGQVLLYSKKIKEGAYVNMDDKRTPIKGLKDVKGAVLDISQEPPLVVLTQEEFEQGLFDTQGKKLNSRFLGLLSSVTSGAMGLLGSAAKGYFQFAALPFKAVGWVAKGISKLVSSVLADDDPVDLYLKDDLSKPVVTVKQMQEGVVFNADKKSLIRHQKDIKGPVYILFKTKVRQVISKEDLQEGNVVDFTGKKVKIGKKGFFGRAIGGAMDLAGSALDMFGKAAALPFKLIGGGIKLAGNLLSGGMKRLGNWINPKNRKGDASTATVIVLQQILGILEERLKKPRKVRRGSWMERMANEGKDDQGITVNVEGGEKKEEQSWLSKFGGMLLAPLTGLFAKGKSLLMGGLRYIGSGLMKAVGFGLAGIGKGIWGVTKLLGRGIGKVLGYLGRGFMNLTRMLGGLMGIGGLGGGMGRGRRGARGRVAARTGSRSARTASKVRPKGKAGMFLGGLALVGSLLGIGAAARASNRPNKEDQENVDNEESNYDQYADLPAEEFEDLEQDEGGYFQRNSGLDIAMDGLMAADGARMAGRGIRAVTSRVGGRAGLAAARGGASKAANAIAARAAVRTGTRFAAVQGAKMAGRAAMAAVPVVGWVALAADLAWMAGSAAWNKTNYGTFRPLRSTRVSQYGLKWDDSDQGKKAALLEEILEPFVRPEGENKWNVVATDEDIEEKLYNIFEVNKDAMIMPAGDEERYLVLEWYKERFAPVFIKWASSLKQMKPDVKLIDADDKLDAQEKINLLNLCKDVSVDALSYNSSPFGNIEITPEQINDIHKRALVDVAAGLDKNAGSRGLLKSITSWATGDSLFAKAARWTPIGFIANQTNKFIESREDAARQAILNDPEKMAQLQDGSKAGEGLTRPAVPVEVELPNLTLGRKLRHFEALRFLVYGLPVNLDQERLMQLYRLEEALLKNNEIEYNNNIAKIKLTEMEAFEKYGTSIFQVPKSRVMDFWLVRNARSRFGGANYFKSESERWRLWFTRRFTPAFCKFYAWMKSKPEYASGDLQEIDKTLLDKKKANLLSQIGNSLIELECKQSVFGKDSIWNFRDSPWPLDKEDLEIQVPREAAQNLLRLIQQQIVEEPAEIEGAPNVNNQKFTEEQKERLRRAIVTMGASEMSIGDRPLADPQAPSEQFANPTPTSPAHVNRDLSLAQQPSSQPYTGGISAVTGQTFSHPGNGKDGDINSIPMPPPEFFQLKDLYNKKQTQRRAELAAPVIKEASDIVGVNPKLMMNMAGIESRFLPTAGVGTSSAGGLYQFINSTWTEMLAKHGKKYGLNPSADKFDPRANALMGAEFIKDNYDYLKRNLGRDPSDTDLYTAHFMGAEGARQLLTTDPSADAAGLFPAPAKANQSIFYGNGRRRNVSQVLKELDDRMKAYRPYSDQIDNLQDNAFARDEHGNYLNEYADPANIARMSGGNYDSASLEAAREAAAGRPRSARTASGVNPYGDAQAEIDGLNRLAEEQRLANVASGQRPTAMRFYDGSSETTVPLNQPTPDATTGSAIMNQVVASGAATPVATLTPPADSTATQDRQAEVRVAAQQHQVAQAAQQQQSRQEDRSNRLMESLQSQQLTELKAINTNVVEVVNVLKSFNMHEFKMLLTNRTKPHEASPNPSANKPVNRGPWKTDEELGPAVIDTSRAALNQHLHALA